MDLIEVGTWMVENAFTMLNVLTTLATLVMAYLMYKANRLASENISQTLQLEKEKSRPFVFIDMEHRNLFQYVIVKNIGATQALDVKISIEPKLMRSKSDAQRDISITSKQISFLAPQRELVDYIDAGHQFFKDYDPPVFYGTIEYRDVEGIQYNEKFHLDLSYQLGMATISGPTVPKEIEKLRNEVKGMKGLFADFLSLYNTNNPE